MGSYMNFENIDDTSQQDARPPASHLPLARQPSIYSLTFDEFQNTIGGSFKYLGSMNMEDLLKSIWTAEDSHQALQSPIVGPGPLQRQGSLALPRTLSQRTVDEVWRDVLNGKGWSEPPTLGEMTLEDFLAKAGVVREGVVEPAVRSNEVYLYSASNAGPSGLGLAMGFPQQPSPNSFTLTNMTPAASVTSSQPQLQPLFPNHTTVAFSSPTQIGSKTELGSSGFVDTPARVSPSHCDTGGLGRGRRSNSSLERVVERRRRRMIKNRESAARSRARKQAYTLELEEEVAKLKQINEELRQKQHEYMEMQKNQILEQVNKPRGEKKRCLKRMSTGPW